MGYLRDWTGDDTASCRSLWLGKAWKVTQKIILTFSEFAQSSLLPPKGPGPENLLDGWGRNWFRNPSLSNRHIFRSCQNTLALMC